MERERLMKKPNVFISYCHANSEFVEQLADELKKSGVEVWIDKWKIKVGDSIVEKVNDGIGSSDFLIVVLSQASVNSRWVREELNSATIKNIEEEKHAFILPVLIEECELPSLLKHRRYANFKDDPEQAFQDLLEVIQPLKPSEPEIPLPPAKGVNVPVPDALNEIVKKQKCILFLGPMASTPSPEGSRFKYKMAPPSHTELSRRLAKMCNYQDQDVTNLQRVSLFYQSRRSRVLLAEKIRQNIMKPKFVPSPILNMLAALPFPIVITTNYDHLFDSALSRANTMEGRSKRPIIRVYDPTQTGPPEPVPLDPSEERPILLKIYGDIYKPESIVVTEDDYFIFLQKTSNEYCHPIHKNIRLRMCQWPILFIGYDLRDYNLRFLFRMLSWNIDRAHLPLSFVVDPSSDHLVEQVRQQEWLSMERLIRENLWDFVPSLYKKIKGEEYQI